MVNKKLSPSYVEGDNIEISIGDNARNIAAGKNITQSVEGSREVKPEDLLLVRQIFVELRQQVIEEAPSERQTSAIERVEELQEAVLSDKPNLTTIHYVKEWFKKNIPTLAGAVISVLVNPVVGRVVEAAGEIAADQFVKFIKKE